MMAKSNIVNPIINVASKDFDVSKPQKESKGSLELQKEKEEHILKSARRMELFYKIYQNETPREPILKHALIEFAGMLVAVLPTFIYILIPAQSVIKFPEYWSEHVIQFCLICVPLCAAWWQMLCSYLLNVKLVNTFQNFIILSMIMATANGLMYAVVYLVWTKVLYYHYPMPFVCLTSFFITCVTWIISFWYRFPSTWREELKFKKRLKIALATIYLSCIVVFEYYGVNILLFELYGDYQWVVALFLPLIREFNLWIMDKVGSAAAEGDPQSGFMAGTMLVLAVHSINMTYNVGSKATFATTVVVIGTDFLINVAICLRLIYLKKRDGNATATTKQIKLLQELVMNEVIEFQVPLCYLICFIMGYYGPNSGIIGNIGNSYWQYAAVENVTHTVQNVLAFFIFDVLGLLLTGALLWQYCRINLYNAYVAVQKEFGLFMLINLAVTLNGVIAICYGFNCSLIYDTEYIF